ncbi:MAG: c-type cytochrome biogenesis protein CcmI [Gammaproteobacteria bacterium SHHR-1]|uniref:c-type cytochrome biogenesis protein CcmI n=1 Tax=Magnetovirga frankeli TaxID=947516 RepID=UPI001292D0A5|nr:c-type cytochrome biogenesis protein CcmI [gamma proteobacterium SS-5]
MTEFWLLAALILLPGIIILAPPLLRPRIRVASDLNARNVQIARERLAELEREHQAGNLNQAEFEQAKVELEGNMLDDLRHAEDQATDDRASRPTLALLALAIPLAAVLLYQQIGTPEIMPRLASGPAAQHGQSEQTDINQLLAQLEERLKADPDNVEGWFILGRSYMAQEQYPQAVRALEETYRLAPDNPNVMVSLADALAMQAGGVLAGRPQELLQKALQLDANSTTALWLLGMASQEQRDFAQAVAYWQRALPLLQDNAEGAQRLSLMIDQARQMAQQSGQKLEPAPQAPVSAAASPLVPAAQAEATASAAAGAEIQVSVRLSPELAAQAKPEDVVFVLARAVSGPPMPLAAAKYRVADLPLQLSLTDAMAMMPQMKLSNFQQVLVQARIAKGGSPQAQSGDLQSQPLQTSTQGKPRVELTIDRLVP